MNSESKNKFIDKKREQVELMESEDFHLNQDFLALLTVEHRKQDYELVKLEMEMQTVEIPTVNVEGQYSVDQRYIPKIENPRKPINIETQRLYWIRESLKMYNLLKKCVYLDRKKKVASEDDFLVCHCLKDDREVSSSYDQTNRKVSYNCGEKCTNRIMCYECDVNTCPSRECCRNRRFQLHQNARVYPYPYPDKGWGLRAGENINKGQFIIQYLGEIYSLTSEEGKLRREVYKKSSSTYVMKISGNEVIDQTFRGNMSRFVNHSCKPNCMTQRWHVLGEVCIGIFALVDIKEDEELTIDYNYGVFNPARNKCLCGAIRCKGYLGTATRSSDQTNLDDEMDIILCNVCGQNTDDSEDKLVICESCHERIHVYCLNQPVVQNSNWLCIKCRENIKIEYGETNLYSQQNAEGLFKGEAPWETNLRLYKMAKKKQGKGSDHMLSNKANKLIAVEEEESKKDNHDYRRYEKQYYFFKRLEIQAKKEINETVEEDEDYAPLFDRRSRILNNEPKKGKESGKLKQKPSAEGPKGNQKQIKAKEAQKDKGGSIKDNRIKKALELFKRELAEHPELINPPFEMESEQNDDIIHNTLLLNKLQLDVLKYNQQVLLNVGVSMFWDPIPQTLASDLEIFRRNIELSVDGKPDQMESFGDVMKLVMKAAGTVQRSAGCFEAMISLPAIYLRKLIGQSHSNQIELEKKHSVIIEYSEDQYNDNSYSIAGPTNIRVKGLKKNIEICHKAINTFILSLTTLSVFFSPHEIKIIKRNLTEIEKLIHPVEIRISREPMFEELDHPLFYIKYKEREVTLIGTTKETLRAEEIVRSFLKKESERLRFPILIEGHFLWPAANRETLNRLKSELIAECRGSKFFFYEPGYVRDEMTINISAKKEFFNGAKSILKAKFKKFHQAEQSFDNFQENVKAQAITTLIQFLYASVVLTKPLGFWDLFSTELEFLNKVVHAPTKQFLEKLIQKDVSLQLYLISLLNIDQKTARQVFSLSTGNIFAEVRKASEQLKTHSAFSQKTYQSVLADPVKPKTSKANNVVKQVATYDSKTKSQNAFNPPRMFNFSDDTNSKTETDIGGITQKLSPPFHSSQQPDFGINTTNNVPAVSGAYGSNTNPHSSISQRFNAISSLRQIQEPMSVVPKMFRYSESIGIIQDTTLELNNLFGTTNNSSVNQTAPDQPRTFNFSDNSNMQSKDSAGHANQNASGFSNMNQKKDSTFTAPRMFSFNDDNEEGFITSPQHPAPNSNNSKSKNNNSYEPPPRMFSFNDDNEEGFVNDPKRPPLSSNNTQSKNNSYQPPPRIFSFNEENEEVFITHTHRPPQSNKMQPKNNFYRRPPMFGSNDQIREQRVNIDPNLNSEIMQINRGASNNPPRKFNFGESDEIHYEPKRNYSGESNQGKQFQSGAPRMFNFGDSAPSQSNQDPSHRRDNFRPQNNDRDSRGFRNSGSYRNYDNRNPDHPHKAAAAADDDDDYDNLWKSTKDDPTWKNLSFINSKIETRDNEEVKQRSLEKSLVVASSRLEEEQWRNNDKKPNLSTTAFPFNPPRIFSFDPSKTDLANTKPSSPEKNTSEYFSRKERPESSSFTPKKADQDMSIPAQNKKMQSDISIEIKGAPEVRYNPLLQRVNMPPPRVFQFADDSNNKSVNSGVQTYGEDHLFSKPESQKTSNESKPGPSHRQKNEYNTGRTDNQRTQYEERDRDSRYHNDWGNRNDEKFQTERRNRNDTYDKYNGEDNRNRSYDWERDRNSPSRQLTKIMGSQKIIQRRTSGRDQEHNFGHNYQRGSPDRYEKAKDSSKERERNHRNRSKSHERSDIERSYSPERNRDSRKRSRSRSRSKSREKSGVPPPLRNDQSPRRKKYDNLGGNQNRSTSPEQRSHRLTMKMKIEDSDNKKRSVDNDSQSKGENGFLTTSSKQDEYSRYFKPVRIFQMPIDSPEREEHHSKSKGGSNYGREGKDTRSSQANSFIMSFQKQEPRDEVDDY